MKTLFALLSKSGTACSETCMCKKCFNDAEKKSVVEERAKISNKAMFKQDKAILGSWTNVTDNEYLQRGGCVAC